MARAHRIKGIVSLAALMLATSPSVLAQQAPAYQTPHTSWGAPDLQGVWTNASITKLTRPAGIDHLVLTPAEAKALEDKDFNNQRTAAELKPTDQSTGAPVRAASLPGVGNYNAVWVDPGSTVATIKGERRSSWIVDPPNGRIPISPEGRQKMAAWRPDATRDGSFQPDPASLAAAAENEAHANQAEAVASAPAKGRAAAKAKAVPAKSANGVKGKAAAKAAPAKAAPVVVAVNDPKPFIDAVAAPRGNNGVRADDDANGAAPAAASAATVARAAAAARSYMGPESRSLGERCIVGFGNTGGPVMNNVLYNNHYQIFQSPGYVVIEVEMDHDARIVPIVKSAAEAASHFGPKAIPKWLGDSVGWFEGDTLVVESRNFNRQHVGQVFISDTGTLQERFTRVGPDDIVYEFKVEDPEVYTQAWRGEVSWRQTKDNIYEYACHEGNYGLLGILKGARMQEREGRALELTRGDEG